MKKLIFLIGILLVLFEVVSAAHYIVGYVQDAKDGKTANGKTVRMWRADNVNDYLIGIIGPGGASGTDNVYMLDCDMMQATCNIGDVLRLMVEENSDDYIGLNIVDVTVTSAGYDLAENLTINSPPNVSNIYPKEFGNVSGVVNFNCSASDLDENLVNISLYGNWGAGWHLNETKSISGFNDYQIFSKLLGEGTYQYSCRAQDERGIFSFPDIATEFRVDHTPPVINSVSYNVSYICGAQSIRVSCNTTDSFTGVEEVLINVNGFNYSASYLGSEIYYLDIYLSSVGEYEFACYSKDFAGNLQEFVGENLTVRSSGADFNVREIFFSETAPIEGEIVNVEAEITNEGCGDAFGVLMGLYLNHPIQNDLIEETTSDFLEGQTKNVSFNFEAVIGRSNLFVFADSNNSFVEDNEENNILNKTLFVNSWQIFYGNISADKLIGKDDGNISIWFDEPAISGNIFVVDKEAEINWLNLQAIGRDVNGAEIVGDFSKVDSVLGMSSLDDSIEISYENYFLKDFLVHQKYVYNVPVINSSLGSPFVTGILWDMTKDTNGYFDLGDKEDIVFVTEVIRESVGAYGTYDYEINVPVKIRDFYDTGSKEIYFYYDLN